MRQGIRLSSIVASGFAASALLLAACGSTDNAVNAPVPAAVQQTPPSTLIPGFNLPQVLAASADGTKLYAAQNDGSVMQLDTPKYNIAGSWNSGIENPLGIALSPDGKTVYLSNRAAGTVSLRDASTGGAITSWSSGAGSGPTGIGLSPDGATIYVPQNASAGTGANKLTVRKANNGELAQTWALESGSRPRAAVVSPDGSTVYVSMEGSNRISARSAKDGSETASWSLAKSGLGTPGYLALSKKGDLLYASAASPSGVVAIKTSDGSIQETWTKGISSAFGIAAASCGQTVFVTGSSDPGNILAVDQPNQCAAEVPSAPLNVVASSTDKETIVVKWDAPADAGSSAITTYTATANQKNGKERDTCTADGRTLTCTMDSVNGGKVFNVTVTATNGEGAGPESSPPIEVTAKKK